MADKETKGIVINIEAQTGTVSRQINALRSEFKKFEKDISAFNKAFTLDGTSLVSYETKLYAMSRAAEESKKVVSELASAMKKMESTGLDTDNIHSYAILAQRLAESKQQAQEATTRLNELKTGISTASSYATEFGNNFAKANQQIEQINTAFKFDSSTVENASVKLQLLETSSNSAKNAIEMLQEEMSLRLANGASLADPKITELAATIANMKNNFENSQQAISSYVEELANVASGFAQAQEHAQAFADRFSTLQNTVKNLDTALNIDPSNLDLICAKMDVLDSAVDASKGKIEQLEEALRTKLAMGMTYADPEVAQLAASLAQAKQELESAKLAAETFSNSLNPISSEMQTTSLSADGISTSFSTFEVSLKNVAGDTSSVLSSLKKLRNDGLVSAKKAAEDTSKAIKALAKAMVLNPQGFETTSELMQLLKNEAQETQDYIDLLNKELEEPLDSNYELTANEIANLKGEVAEATEKLKQINDTMQRLKGTAEESDDAVLDLAGANGELSNSNDELNTSINTTTNSISAMTIALGNLAAQAIRRCISEVKQLATEVFNTGLEYDEASNSLKAMYGSVTDSEFETLSSQFRELGLNSEKSATEIANSAQSLALAGYNIEQTSNAIKPIMQLSEATGESFETLSSIVVDGLAEFGMESDQATHFADVLAKAALSTNTDVTQLGEAMKYAGSVAGSFGYSVEDVAQALGTMASQGVKGTQAGSSLRTMLTRVASNTSECNDKLKALGVNFFDSNGNANDLSDTLSKLREVMADMSTEEQAQLAYTVMGTRGLTALTAIVNTSAEDWEDLGTKIANAGGTVEQVANTRLDNLYGDTKKFSNALDELSYTMMDTVKPSLRELTQSLTSLFNSSSMKTFIKTTGKELSSIFKDIANAVKKLTPHINEVVSVAKGLVEVFGSLIIANKVNTAISSLQTTFTGITTAISGLMSGSLTLTAALGGVGAVISGLIILFGSLSAVNEVMEGRWKDEHQSLVDLTNDYDSLKESIDSTKESMSTSAEETYNSYNNNMLLIDELDNLVDSNGKVKAGYENRVEYILGQLKESYGIEYELVDGVIQKYQELSAQLKQTAQDQATYNYVESLNEQMTELYQDLAETKALQKEAASVVEEELDNFFENTKGLTDGSSNYVKEFFEDQKEQFGISYEDFMNFTNEEQRKFVQDNSDIFGFVFGDKALSDATDKLDEITHTYAQTYEDIKNIQNAVNLAENGDLDGAVQAIYDYENNVTDSISTTQEQIATLQQQYDAYTKEMHESTNADTIRALNAQRNEVMESIKELQGEVTSPENQIVIGIDQQRSTTMAQEAVTGVKQTTTDGFNSMANGDDGTLASANEAGQATGESLTSGMVESTETGFTEEGGVISTADARANDTYNKIMETLNAEQGAIISKHFLQGIINGLNDQEMIAKLNSAAQAVAEIPANKMRNYNMIQSPSKLAKKLANYWDEGIVLGLQGGMTDIEKAANDVAKVMSAGMALGSSAIGSSISSGSNYAVTQNLTFNGSYSKRDGLSVARDLDRLLGGVI